MPAKPRVVIVGGGLAGAFVVLDPKLHKVADITLVDTKDYFEARTARAPALCRPHPLCAGHLGPAEPVPINVVHSSGRCSAIRAAATLHCSAPLLALPQALGKLVF